MVAVMGLSTRQVAVTGLFAVLAAVMVARWMNAPMPQTRGGVHGPARNPNLHKRLATRLSPDTTPDASAAGYPQHIAHPLELGLSVLVGPHPMYRHSTCLSPNCSRVADQGWAGWAMDPPSEVSL